MTNKHGSVFAGLPALVSAICLYALAPADALAFDPPPPGTNLCLSVGTNPFFADVTGTAGSELVVTSIQETIQADADMDDLSVVRAAVSVQVLNRTGGEEWRSDKLILFSPDLATVLLGGGLFPDTYFFPGLTSNTFNTLLFSGGYTCYGTAFAVEANGSKYLAVAIGFIAQDGDDESTGVDESRVNVWILNGDDGSTVHVHELRPRGGRYLSAVTLSGIGPVDSDADDDLVAAWVVPLGDGGYKLRYETYNILTGVLEDKFDVFTKDTRVYE
jgi:hypothetical protein